LQVRLDGGIGGDEPELTRADRQLQNAGEANTLRLQRVAADRRGKGRLQDLHVVTITGALGGVAEGQLRSGRLGVEGKVVFDLYRHPHIGMVAQVLPDPG